MFIEGNFEDHVRLGGVRYVMTVDIQNVTGNRRIEPNRWRRCIRHGARKNKR